MNYIYDVLVNFNDDELLDFYEWDKNDNIEHLRRIPLFKVSTQTLKDFKNSRVKVDYEFLKEIKNKTEIFLNKMIKYIEFAAIFTDGADLIVLELSKNGDFVLKSSMLLDEAEEVLEESELLDEKYIKYEKLEANDKYQLMTRLQRKILKYLKKELDYLIKNKNYNKLKYLYYEWYNKKIDNMDKVKNDLYKILDLEFSEKHNNFYNLIKFSNTKKQIEQK